ncbi:hypothetical protein NOR53_1949 [gamma proteobacterium NOR5-3]|nr:hypothetical protein NOR53_1949 [gamma proteobacterium NOR5-3]
MYSRYLTAELGQISRFFFVTKEHSINLVVAAQGSEFLWVSQFSVSDPGAVVPGFIVNKEQHFEMFFILQLAQNTIFVVPRSENDCAAFWSR